MKAWFMLPSGSEAAINIDPVSTAADVFTPLTTKAVRLAEPSEFAIFEVYPQSKLGTTTNSCLSVPFHLFTMYLKQRGALHPPTSSQISTLRRRSMAFRCSLFLKRRCGSILASPWTIRPRTDWRSSKCIST